MATGGITVSASQEFVWYGNNVQTRIRSAAIEATRKTAEEIKDQAVAYTREDTGAAKESWGIEGPEYGGGTASYLVNSRPDRTTKRPGGAPYVGWLENGWTDRAGVWHPGDHMLRRSIDEHADRLIYHTIREWDSRVSG